MLFNWALLERGGDHKCGLDAIYRQSNVTGVWTWCGSARDPSHTPCTCFDLTSDTETCVTGIAKCMKEGIMQESVALRSVLPVCQHAGVLADRRSRVRQDPRGYSKDAAASHSISQPVCK